MRCYRDLIEVCISDNCSTDNTNEVVNFWKTRYKLIYVKQSKNKGASQNIIEVTQLANSRYTLLLGDDDGIDRIEFLRLIDQLNSEKAYYWNVGVSGSSANMSDDFRCQDSGVYHQIDFNNLLAKKGLISMGFIGKHIIPTFIVKCLREMNTEVIRPWPHLHLYFSKYNNVPTRIVPYAFYKQAVQGSQLFWNSMESVNIILDFQKIFKFKDQDLIYKSLRRRELVRVYLLLALIRFFLTDQSGFKKNALAEYLSSVSSKDRYFIGVIFFISIIRFLLILDPLIRPILGFIPFVKRYNKSLEESMNSSASMRGL